MVLTSSFRMTATLLCQPTGDVGVCVAEENGEARPSCCTPIISQNTPFTSVTLLIRSRGGRGVSLPHSTFTWLMLARFLFESQQECSLA